MRKVPKHIDVRRTKDREARRADRRLAVAGIAATVLLYVFGDAIKACVWQAIGYVAQLVADAV